MARAGSLGAAAGHSLMDERSSTATRRDRRKRAWGRQAEELDRLREGHARAVENRDALAAFIEAAGMKIDRSKQPWKVMP